MNSPGCNPGCKAKRLATPAGVEFLLNILIFNYLCGYHMSCYLPRIASEAIHIRLLRSQVIQKGNSELTLRYCPIYRWKSAKKCSIASCSVQTGGGHRPTEDLYEVGVGGMVTGTPNGRPLARSLPKTIG